MRLRLLPALALLAAGLPLAAAETVAGPAPEPVDVGTTKIPVSPKKELTIKAREDAEVAMRELWYQQFDGKEWGKWQKHGITFNRETPITWAPPEGHWRIYVRVVLTSGLASTDPAKEPEKVKPAGEFIIDRSAPTVAIAYPAPKQKLRGGDKYAIKWDASDPYLRNAPISIRWSRDGAAWETVAEGIANAGSYDWTVPQAMTTAGVLRVEAMDKATNVGLAESNGIIVDSVKPRGKVVGPAISARQDVTMDLDIADAGPSGLQAARLYVSQDDGGSWTEGPFVQEPFKAVAWKAPGDGKFRLAVVATDGAGNQGAAPKGKGEEQFVLTVDTTAPVVQLVSAIGITDSASAQASNRRDFKPGDRLAVPFVIKDANLAPNSVTVWFQPAADKGWIELAKGQAADVAYRWVLPADAQASKSARIKVSAVDAAGNIGEAVASETFTIQTEVAPTPVTVDLGL